MAELRHTIPALWETGDRGIYDEPITEAEREASIGVLNALRAIVLSDPALTIREQDWAGEGTPQWVCVTGPIERLVRIACNPKCNPRKFPDQCLFDRPGHTLVRPTTKAEYDWLKANGIGSFAWDPKLFDVPGIRI